MIPHVAAPLVLICKEHVEKVSFERVFAAKTSSGLFVYFTPTLTYTRTHTHARRPEAQEGVVTSPLPHCKLETQIGASPKLLSLAGSTAPLPYLFFFFTLGHFSKRLSPVCSKQTVPRNCQGFLKGGPLPSAHAPDPKAPLSLQPWRWRRCPRCWAQWASRGLESPPPP